MTKSSAYLDKVALVTGAGSGIGEALVRELARRGARVVATDRRGDEAERVARSVPGGRVRAAELDVRSDEFARVVDETVAREGEPDFLFNNAGIGVAGEVQDLALADWHAIVDVNVLGVVRGIAAVYPRMVARRSGHIINTASMAGLMPTPITTPYGMTKHAVVGLSRSLRIEAAEYGVRVTALCPGVIRTPILEGGAFGRFSRKPSPGDMRREFDRAFPMDVGRFAHQVLDRLPSNPARLIVPRAWSVVDFVNRLSPTFGEFVARLAYRDMKPTFDRGVPRADGDGEP